MLIHLQDAKRRDIIRSICARAKQYAEKISAKPVSVYLVDHKARVLENV